jgi:hypothetical protein
MHASVCHQNLFTSGHILKHSIFCQFLSCVGLSSVVTRLFFVSVSPIDEQHVAGWSVLVTFRQ